MAKTSFPVTPAVRALRAAKVSYQPHLYDYQPKGGTSASSSALGVDEHTVIKTLVFEDEQRQPLVVLMHGDRRVSTKQLARALGSKRIEPCEPSVAQKHSGYQVGGTSPFGTRRKLPVYLERSVLELERVFVNGGKRGFLVSLCPTVFVDVLGAQLVEVAIEA